MPFKAPPRTFLHAENMKRISLVHVITSREVTSAATFYVILIMYELCTKKGTFVKQNEEMRFSLR